MATENASETSLEADEALVERFKQQWLLSPARPLTERLGREFFLQLPKSPGVYLMHGHGGRPRRHRVLYVGKSRNLRQRLNSYRHVHPDRDSRKTVRLVHSVETITYEECEDETAALLRENALLREHRPLFNRMNVRPEAHGYIGLQLEGRCLRFRLAADPDDRYEWFGAFKGGRRFALASLLRLLVQWERGIEDSPGLPRVLCGDTAPAEFEVPMKGASRKKQLLASYLRGRSWKIIEHLSEWVEAGSTPEAFLQRWRENDLEIIRKFYLNGPRRNLRWRRKLRMTDDQMLRREDLDDLPIKIQLAAEPSPWPEQEIA